MRRSYWWVNHKQTHREEIEGQYLWSPKVKSNGASNQFYDNMRLAGPGDLVLSFANAKIGFIGRVTDFAISAPKPKEFGNAGANWKNDGWLLPVFWVPLEPEFMPQEHIDEIRDLLPETHSPIRRENGLGNQGAYLAKISVGLFNEVTKLVDYDGVKLSEGGSNSLRFETIRDELDESVEQAVLSDKNLSETEKENIVKSRRGQGVFRRSVEQIEPECRLTGINNPKLLIASHIKPWRSCSTAKERLDGHNGLMLTPDADHLFDRGYVSFEDDGSVLVSNRIETNELDRLGFTALAQGRRQVRDIHFFSGVSKGFLADQQKYLSHHREVVFLG